MKIALEIQRLAQHEYEMILSPESNPELMKILEIIESQISKYPTVNRVELFNSTLMYKVTIDHLKEFGYTYQYDYDTHIISWPAFTPENFNPSDFYIHEVEH